MKEENVMKKSIDFDPISKRRIIDNKYHKKAFYK